MLTRRALPALMLLALALPLTGCQTVRGVFERDWRYDKPTIAVHSFENRAPFPLAWSLGDGFAEVLTTELMETDRFHLVDRQHIDAILGELALQQSDLTRPQQRLQQGRIRNAHYLIRGTVTDFSHTARGGLGALWRRWHIGLAGWVARVSMVIQVIDVETSEVLLSEQVDGHAWAVEGDVEAVYSSVAFGGNAFYQTPLGRATRRTIERGMDDIVDVIGRQRWQPRVARVDDNGTVLLNGGENRRLRVGDRWEILELGPLVFDPVTGDVLGREESRIVGQVEIYDVQERFARASVLHQTEDLDVGARLANRERMPRGGWTVTGQP